MENRKFVKQFCQKSKNRLKGGKVKNKDGEYEIKPGTWSHFDYDFSNAVFFYAVSLNEVVFPERKSPFQRQSLSNKLTSPEQFSSIVFTSMGQPSTSSPTSLGFTSIRTPISPWFTSIGLLDSSDLISIGMLSSLELTSTGRLASLKLTSMDMLTSIGFTSTVTLPSSGFTSTKMLASFRQSFPARLSHQDTVSMLPPDSPYKIETKEEEYNGIKFTIPEEAELFDPNIPSE